MFAHSILLLLLVSLLWYTPCALSQPYTLPLSDWMRVKSSTLWNKSLSELTIPGTHVMMHIQIYWQHQMCTVHTFIFTKHTTNRTPVLTTYMIT